MRYNYFEILEEWKIMPPEIQTTVINLIIGAIIGFVFSTLSVFVAHKLQLQRDTQARKWQKEDEQRNIKREIYKKRAIDAESFIESIYAISGKIAELEYKIIEKDEPLKYIGDNFLLTIENEVDNTWKRLSLSPQLFDEDLITYAGDLRELNSDEALKLKDLFVAKQNEKLNPEQEISRVKDYMVTATIYKSKYISRLDQLLSSI